MLAPSDVGLGEKLWHVKTRPYPDLGGVVSVKCFVNPRCLNAIERPKDTVYRDRARLGLFTTKCYIGQRIQL